VNDDLDPSLLRFLDIEASGLHVGSFPIEVGWADTSLATDGFLVKPDPAWSMNEWSGVAQTIHGISREETIADGIDVVQAANRLNAALGGMIVVSDNPFHDTKWTIRLFRAARVVPAFDLKDWTKLCQLEAARQWLDQAAVSALEAEVRAAFPRPHRAQPDALSNAALYVALRGGMVPGQKAPVVP
jgi:hypothetical protein